MSALIQKSVWNRAFFFFLLFSCLLTVSAQDSLNLVDYKTAKEVEIGGIKVTGTQFLDTKVLIALSGLRVGEKIKIPGEEITKAIKALWKQRLFTNISIQADRIVDKTVFLTIAVEERPRIARYNLKGIKTSEAEDVRKKLDLRAGSIFTDNVRATAEHTIKQFFIEKGYLDVNVSIKEKRDTLLANSVLVQIFVDKGVKVHIDHINIYGNHEFTENKIKKQMKETKEKVKFDLDGLFSFKKNFKRDSIKVKWYQIPGNISGFRAYDYASKHINLNIFKASKFKRKDYEEDKKKIIEQYYSKGFRDAKILRDSVYSVDSKNLNIDLYIDEGKKYYFRNIYWNGNTKYQDSLLSRMLGIKKGDVYNQKALDERLFMNPNGGDVSSLYMDDGYLFFSVTPNEVKVEGDSIDLEMRINEGPQATIRDVRIMGNTKTNERIIRRELRTLPGNKFSRSDLIRSQREIVNLGYFDPQQLDVVPIPNPETGTVDIEYRVTEKPSDQLELSAGYGGAAYGVTGTLGVTFTNFSLKNIGDKKSWAPLPSGDGQRLSVRVQSGGRRNQFYTTSFTEPWLGGKKPISFTVSFNRTRLNTIDYTNNSISGYYLATGVSVDVGSRLKRPDDFFTVIGSLNYQAYNISNYSGFPLFSKGRANNLNFKLTFSRNSVDAPLYPKHGANISMSAAFTLPYSLMFPGRRNINYKDPNLPTGERYKLAEFHKWKFTVDWYVTLVQNLVLKTSAKLGFLGLYNKDLGYSAFERYEVGGDGLSAYQILGKEIVSLRGYPIISPSGGAPIFNKYTMELRYPISLNPSATVYALMFLEAGNTWNSISEYKPYELKRSIGAGIRVFLPMFGLLGFDYGIGFDKTGADVGAGSNIFSKYGQFKIILGFEPE